MTTSITVCPVCGSGPFTDLYAELVRCEECNFITAANLDVTESFSDLYKEDYFSGDEYADYFGDKKVIQKNLRKWLKVVHGYVPGGSLVEVGSAYGFFLQLAQEDFDVVGYEVDAEVVEASRLIVKGDVRTADFLTDNQTPDESVDAVVMWDVIEHLAEPDRFVERAAQILRPGGYIFMTTGDIDAWLPRRQRAGWRLIHPPTHLQYFSANTMKRLLERWDFEVVQIFHPGYWRTAQQILHGLFVFNKPNRPSIAYRILKNILPSKMGIYLNTFDIMFVAARKRVPDLQSADSLTHHPGVSQS